MPDASVPAAKLPDESMICFDRRVRARFRSVLPRKNRPRVGPNEVAEVSPVVENLLALLIELAQEGARTAGAWTRRTDSFSGLASDAQ
jgi:hypothetical protein